MKTEAVQLVSLKAQVPPNCSQMTFYMFNIQKGELCGVSEHLLPTSYPGFQQLSIIRNSDRKDLNGNPPTRGFLH